jgi:hypothetical protein
LTNNNLTKLVMHAAILFFLIHFFILLFVINYKIIEIS